MTFAEQIAMLAKYDHEGKIGFLDLKHLNITLMMRMHSKENLIKVIADPAIY